MEEVLCSTVSQRGLMSSEAMWLSGVSGLQVNQHLCTFLM